MQQPGLVPSKFGGGPGEDAASWLDNLLTANAHASDLGIVRLFVSHLAPGTVAREWYDQLDDGDKSSWKTVERQFYKRWVASPTSACVSDPWMLFSSHTLTEEAIFDGFGPGSEEMINSQQVLVKWVTEHIRLGSNCREDDAVLLRTTLDLIPPFIRAHLRLSYHNDINSLEGLCSEIAKIPMTVVEFERIRRQEADKDWRTMLEKNVREISEKVDGILEIIKKMDPFRADHPLAEVLEKDTTVDGSIAWEPNSPITATTSRENLVPTRSATPTTAIQSTLIAAKEESNEIVGEDSEVSPIDNKPDALRMGSPFSSSIQMRTSSNLTKTERIGISQASVNHTEHLFINRSNAKYVYDGEGVVHYQVDCFVSTLTLHDRLSCDHKYKAKIIDFFMKTRCGYTGSFLMLANAQNRYEAFHGIALLDGYCVYDLPQLLISALSYWTSLTAYIVTADQPEVDTSYHVRNRYHSQSTSFHRDSSGNFSLIGSLVMVHGKAQISSFETVAYMTLSAYLAESTGDDKFKEKALLTANCIKSHIIDAETNLVKDCIINGLTCETERSTLSCHLTGMFIRGLAILATITDDTTWTTLLLEVAKASMQYPDWHDNGILIAGIEGEASENNDQKCLRGLLMRGLLEAYERNPSNEEFRTLVRRYVNVQYTALLEKARRKNEYGVDWRGPYKGPYPHAQLAALDTLIAAVGVATE